MNRAFSRTFVVVTSAIIWLTIALASAALWPIYRSAALVTLIIVSVIAGSLVALASLWRKWSFPTTSLAAIVVFLIIGVPLAVPSETQYGIVPTWPGLADLVLGVALGWKQVLTISLPVGSYQALLVPALVLVFGATVVSLSIAFRTKGPELSVIPSVVLFLAAVAFGPTYPDRPVTIAIALLVAVALALVWFRWRRRRDTVNALEAAMDTAGEARRRREFGFAGARTAISAVIILAIAASAAVVVANALPPNSNRSVLRTAIVEPFDPRDYVSPLAGFRRYWQPSTANSVLFEVSGVPLGTRIRLATLDSYDGVVYAVGSGRVSSESGSFARVPSRFDQSSVTGDPVAMTITIASYAGVWLPTAGLFEEIDFTSDRASELRDSFYYNRVTGTAAVTERLESGDSYSFEGILPAQPSNAEISSLTPGNADVPLIGVAPEELNEKLDEYVRGATDPGEQLVAMLAGLTTDGYVSHGVGVDEPASRSGHSADRVAELFAESRMIGDGEQYATAASIMANRLGFPTRVVLGFVTSDSQIRGNDVSAWIEVNTAEYGWVTIDPNPPLREIPDEDPDDIAQVARPQTVVQPPEIESDTLNRQSNPDSEQALQPDLDPLLQAVLAVLRSIGWTLLVLGVIAAPFLLIVAAKVRRRLLRRRADSTLEQISGGWQEFEDSMLDHGYSPPVSGTRTEVAAVVQKPAAHDLAVQADRAIFSGADPKADEVDTFWTDVTELESQLHTGLSRWARFKTKISLRSLGGYSVTSLFKR
ncbi:transglutaminase-like domain-containing protein [Salinibacterium sp. M195]|uniref:transglutaminase-like domain-containing protein n=1 Tax=Salinibacterium sp. M195 TaxID=2583374 RepID=UPI001C63B33B|nr:transglutaminase-like domain-containing protein [Salinibacterium sp. M195]QYH36535.1 transglutaminase domain-containing protein [Salinibacterium sp. M195]